MKNKLLILKTAQNKHISHMTKLKNRLMLEISEESSGNTENVDAEAIVHTEALVDVAGYYGNTHMTTEYLITMYVDVEDIDKYDKKTWSTSYKEIDEPYFVEVKLLTIKFTEYF